MGDGGEPALEPRDGVGTPDGFRRLWTPHRLAYIKEAAASSAEEGCPFCRIPRLRDEEADAPARHREALAHAPHQNGALAGAVEREDGRDGGVAVDVALVRLVGHDDEVCAVGELEHRGEGLGLG